MGIRRVKHIILRTCDDLYHKHPWLPLKKFCDAYDYDLIGEDYIPELFVWWINWKRK